MINNKEIRIGTVRSEHMCPSTFSQFRLRGWWSTAEYTTTIYRIIEESEYEYEVKSISPYFL